MVKDNTPSPDADFLKAQTLKKELSDTIVRHPGVASVGLRQSDDGQWCILVRVERGAKPPSLPASFKGLSVETDETDPITPLSAGEKPAD